MEDPSKRSSLQEYADIGRLYAERLTFLMQASAILASCLRKEDIFDRLARAAVPVLADWCSIIIVDQGHGGADAFKWAGMAHANPALDCRLRERIGRHHPNPDANVGIPLAIRTGRSELIRRISVTETVRELTGGVDDLELAGEVKRFGFASMMTTPLTAHGRILGAISMFVGPQRPPYEPSDLALAEELARRAALALHALLSLEHAKQDREVLENVIELYRGFVQAHVEDIKTPLTAARLKLDLLSRIGARHPEDQVMLAKAVADFDRALSAIKSLADESVIHNLVAEARGISAA
jgi:GAF domain-containing protein